MIAGRLLESIQWLFVLYVLTQFFRLFVFLGGNIEVWKNKSQTQKSEKIKVKHKNKKGRKKPDHVEVVEKTVSS